MELLWEVERYQAPERAHVGLPRPPREAHQARGRPAPARPRHDRATDVRGFAKWYNEVLGFRIMAYTVLDEAPITVFSVLTTNEKSHDLGVVLDSDAVPGRINHYAFWVDTREELLHAADVLMENGIHIEYGPSIHGIGEQTFLYFRDPSGLRIEVNTGGYRNYVPDWEPNTWKPSRGSNNLYRNGAMPMSMTESFPPDPGKPTATEEGIVPGTEEALINPYAVCRAAAERRPARPAKSRAGRAGGVANGGCRGRGARGHSPFPMSRTRPLSRASATSSCHGHGAAPP